MFNRSLAIKILEQHDNTWEYEDMSDDELIFRLASTIECPQEKQELITKCKNLTCAECWNILLIKGDRCKWDVG